MSRKPCPVILQGDRNDYVSIIFDKKVEFSCGNNDSQLTAMVGCCRMHKCKIETSQNKMRCSEDQINISATVRSPYDSSSLLIEFQIMGYSHSFFEITAYYENIEQPNPFDLLEIYKHWMIQPNWHKVCEIVSLSLPS